MTQATGATQSRRPSTTYQRTTAEESVREKAPGSTINNLLVVKEK